MYRKDDIDVSNQEHTAPVYFQSLSLEPIRGVHV